MSQLQQAECPLDTDGAHLPCAPNGSAVPQQPMEDLLWVPHLLIGVAFGVGLAVLAGLAYCLFELQQPSQRDQLRKQFV